jgi:zinc protease
VAAYLQGFTLSEKGLESVAFDYSEKSLHEKIVFGQASGGIKTAALAKPVRGDLVTFNVNFKQGTSESLRGQSTAASMAGAMLFMGTSTMTRQQIQDELVKLGASLNLNFSAAGGGLSLKVKKDNVMPAFKIAMQLLKDSTFPEKEFEEIRSTSLKSIEGAIKDKSAQADNKWSRYGNPYSKGDPRYAPTLEESEAEIKSITRKEAFNFYRRFYGAANAKVSILGPIDVKAFEKEIVAELGKWQSKEPWKRVEYPLVDAKPARLTFDTPDKTNVSLSAWHRLPVSSRGMEPEEFSLLLATRIFGGGPGSRLWNRLREKNGISYSVGAGFNASPYEKNGTFSLSAEVAPENVSRAEKALNEELTRALKDGFDDKEVETFKRQYLADRVRNRSGDSYAMGFMSGRMEFDYAKDESAKNDALIASLTTAQVNEAWRKYIQPEKLVWGVFGDQAKVK